MFDVFVFLVRSALTAVDTPRASPSLSEPRTDTISEQKRILTLRPNGRRRAHAKRIEKEKKRLKSGRTGRDTHKGGSGYIGTPSAEAGN